MVRKEMESTQKTQNELPMMKITILKMNILLDWDNNKLKITEENISRLETTEIIEKELQRKIRLKK